MSRFDTRNVLDRLQDTFLAIFNAEWKKNLAPFLILLGINIVWGMMIWLLIPLVLIPMGLIGWWGTGNIILMILIVFILVVLIALFYWITGNIATISSYLIVRKKGIAFQPMELLYEAKTYLGRSLRFDGYYYSFLAVVLFVIFLISMPFLKDHIRQMVELSMGSMDYSALAGELIGVGLIFWLFAIVFWIFSVWFSTKYFTNKPWFILEGWQHLDDFTALGSLIFGNFWNVLGNMIVLGIILSVTWNTLTSLLSGVIGSGWSGIDLSSMKSWDENTDMAALLPKILAAMTPWSLWGGMVIWLLVGTLTNLYRNTFSYILWNDLRTDTDIPEVPKAE